MENSYCLQFSRKSCHVHSQNLTVRGAIKIKNVDKVKTLSTASTREGLANADT